MSTMQAFYDWLFQAPQTEDFHWMALTRLTQANINDLLVLASAADWGTWGYWGS